MDDTISRRAAIQAMQDLPYGYRGMVRDIIYNLPSAQPEIIACGQGELVQDGSRLVQDLISRRAAIEAFKKELTVGESKGNYVTICSAVGYEGARQILESLPSARRKGKWIDLPIPEFGIQCSCCGMTILRVGEKTNYCPSCGAKMERSEDDRNEMD